MDKVSFSTSSKGNVTFNILDKAGTCIRQTSLKLCEKITKLYTFLNEMHLKTTNLYGFHYGICFKIKESIVVVV